MLVMNTCLFSLGVFVSIMLLSGSVVPAMALTTAQLKPCLDKMPKGLTRAEQKVHTEKCKTDIRSGKVSIDDKIGYDPKTGNVVMTASDYCEFQPLHCSNGRILDAKELSKIPINSQDPKTRAELEKKASSGKTLGEILNKDTPKVGKIPPSFKVDIPGKSEATLVGVCLLWKFGVDGPERDVFVKNLNNNLNYKKACEIMYKDPIWNKKKPLSKADQTDIVDYYARGFGITIKN